MTQGVNEGARDWGERVEKTLYDLNSTIREVYSALAVTHEVLAIGIYEDGLKSGELRITVRVAALVKQ